MFMASLGSAKCLRQRKWKILANIVDIWAVWSDFITCAQEQEKVDRQGNLQPPALTWTSSS